MKKRISVVLTVALLLTVIHNLLAQEIFDAVSSSKFDSVRILIERNPQLVHERDSRQRTPLHIAVAVDNKEIVAYLIEKGADVDAKTGAGSTPLFNLTWMTGNMEIARLLIENGADINSESSGNISVLISAAREGRRELVEYLLALGVAIPSPKEEKGKQLLFVSAQRNLIKLFDRLMSLGFDTKERNYIGNNLLHEACKNGSMDMINTLITAEIKTGDANMSGWTPLHYAAESNHRDAAALLLEHKAPIDARTVDGYTAYNIAVELGYEDVAGFLVSKGADQSAPEFPVLKGKYFGQKPPGKIPRPFAPNVFTARYKVHGNVIFSSDGREAYWSVMNFGKDKNGAILESRIENGTWTLPRLASFSKSGCLEGEPFISPDGNRLFFNSSRPIEGQDVGKLNIWVVERNGSSWSEPKPLPQVVNSTQGLHWQSSIDREGNLYFDTGIPGGFGYSDIYCSKFVNGEYSKVVNLGSAINSPSDETNPCIAPDGSYLIISRLGEGLTVFFKKKDGTWTEGKNLSDIIGKKGTCPRVTSDGKYLFFIVVDDYGEYWFPYWVDAGFIEELRKKTLKEY